MFESNPFHNQPLPGERRARAAEIAEDWRLARDGIELLAHGAMICPGCAAPVVQAEPIPAQERLECAYCGHRDRARAYLVRDVFDTVANEAYMVARIPIRVA